MMFWGGFFSDTFTVKVIGSFTDFQGSGKADTDILAHTFNTAVKSQD